VTSTPGLIEKSDTTWKNVMDTNELTEDRNPYSRAQFLDLTKDALEHFYDLTHLESHPFARKVKRKDDLYDATRSQLLQKDLSKAIDMLASGQMPSAGPSPSRRHQVIRLRYIERLTIQNISYELDMSERQVYRDLRQGEEDLATILRSWYLEETNASPPVEAVPDESANLEIEQLKINLQKVDLRTLVYSAQSSTAKLSASMNVSVVIEAPPEPVMIWTDLVVAKHVLINLLSSAIQRSVGDVVRLQLQSDDERTILSLGFFTERESQDNLLNEITTEFLHRLKWEILRNRVQNSIHNVEISFGKNIPTVLVIDDFEGLSRLLKRYLAGYRCRILAAPDGDSGLRMAREIQPDAVILDVMMPHMDGWEVLQRLRNHPDTQHTAVIICSVFNDPGLARALGASSFVSKPIKREDIIQALNREHIF
jgi:CheY-like chemotaxis protein